MDEAGRLHYETQSKNLRLELKTWELDFAKAHNGSKPGRGDIKGNPKIAAMYTSYNKLRDILSGKIPPPPPSPKEDDDTASTDKHRKRKPHDPPSHTPSSKRFRPAETPSRTINAAAAAITPSLSRQLFSPTVPTSIGPTPQRDGRVLGLFDFLPFKDAEIDSPSKPNRSVGAGKAAAAAGPRSAQEHGAAVQETPKKEWRTFDTGVGIAVDLGRTPSSSRKRPEQSPRKAILATPSRQRHDGNRVAKTPSSTHSVSKLQFQTPAFLRRIPMAKIAENSEFVSPEPIRLPRKPLVRGLSSILADLRKTEEEQLDEDLDALREMENEGTSTSTKAASKPSKVNPAPAPKQAGDTEDVDSSILAEDSQKQNMNLLGGFDDEAMYDSQDDEHEGVDRDGKPLKVYKKKGQKRTTRKANMRPVRTKRPPTGPIADPEQAGESDNEAVPETQLGASRTAPGSGKAEEDPALLSGSEFAGSDYDEDGSEDELAQDGFKKPVVKKKTAENPSSSKKQKQTKDGGDKKPEGKVKKAARKVNELAHANFKRLKLRNSGAKGGPGHNSRFRRRR